jgi:hypothetical protein
MATAVVQNLDDFENYFDSCWVCKQCNDNVFQSSDVQTCFICQKEKSALFINWKLKISRWRVMEKDIGRPLLQFQVLNEKCIKVNLKTVQDERDIGVWLAIRKERAKQVEVNKTRNEAVQQLKKQFEDLRLQYSEKVFALQNTVTTLQHREFQEQTLLAENNALKLINAGFEATVKELSAKCEDVTFTSGKLEAVIKTTEGHKLEALKKCSRLETTVFELEAALTGEKEQCRTLSGNLLIVETKYNDLKKVVANYEEKAAELQTKTNEVQVKMKEAEEQKTLLKNQLESLQTQCTELETQRASLEFKYLQSSQLLHSALQINAHLALKQSFASAASDSASAVFVNAALTSRQDYQNTAAAAPAAATAPAAAPATATATASAPATAATASASVSVAPSFASETTSSFPNAGKKKKRSNENKAKEKNKRAKVEGPNFDPPAEAAE